MSKIINISIDVKMINKEKIKVNANGSHYYNMTVMERKDPDQYGNTHYVVEAQTKDERAAKAPKNYLKSSGKEFVFGEEAQVASNDVSQSDDDDDLPF
tara:strand:- start:1494 stop:1787 length:294 start_codon:yes stop_codon:yes gene_type:complete